VRSPEELVRIGFERSRVVIVNECHDGDRHCLRTRAIGRRLLPIANDVSVRHLAMEALYEPFARQANQTRQLPNNNLGYLGQEDMRMSAISAFGKVVTREAWISGTGVTPKRRGISPTSSPVRLVT
jgi:hypothetical protein